MFGEQQIDIDIDQAAIAISETWKFTEGHNREEGWRIQKKTHHAYSVFTFVAASRNELPNPTAGRVVFVDKTCGPKPDLLHLHDDLFVDFILWKNQQGIRMRRQDLVLKTVIEPMLWYKLILHMQLPMVLVYITLPRFLRSIFYF